MKIGDNIIAFVAYKSVPFVKCKDQNVKINIIESDHLGAFYGGITTNGKQVYFREADIKKNKPK